MGFSLKFGKLAGLLGLVVLLYLAWTLRQVLLLMFMAVVFATVLNKFVQQLRKLSVPRKWAVLIVLAVLSAIVGLILQFIIPALANQLPTYTFLSEQGFEQIQEWYRQYRGVVPGDALSDTSLRDLLPQLSVLSPGFVGRALKVFTLSLDFFLNFLLVLVTTIMLLVDPASYRRILIAAFPRFYRKRANAIATKCEKALSGWALGLLFNIVVITLFSGVGLAILGVPLPAVNALLAGCLAFIPNVGPLLSVVPPVLMALSISPIKAIGVLILYLAIQQLEGTVLTPMVMKKQVSLLPAVTLMAQVVFAVWFGFLGLFLALPLVIVSQVWLKSVLVEDVLDRWSLSSRKRRFRALRASSAISKRPVQ